MRFQVSQGIKNIQHACKRLTSAGPNCQLTANVKELLLYVYLGSSAIKKKKKTTTQSPDVLKTSDLMP